MRNNYKKQCEEVEVKKWLTNTYHTKISTFIDKGGIYREKDGVEDRIKDRVAVNEFGLRIVFVT